MKEKMKFRDNLHVHASRNFVAFFLLFVNVISLQSLISKLCITEVFFIFILFLFYFVLMVVVIAPSRVLFLFV